MPMNCWKMDSITPTNSTRGPKLNSGRVGSTSVASMSRNVRCASSSPPSLRSTASASALRPLSTNQRGVSGALSISAKKSSAGIVSEASIQRQPVASPQASLPCEAMAQLTK